MRTIRKLSIALLALAAVCFGAAADAGAVTVNHRSIGIFKDVLFGTGTASVAKGGTTVTLTGGTIPANVGCGDEIVIDDEELYVLGRVSDTELTLQQPAAAEHVDDEFAVRRAYTSIQAWVNDRNGNLVREDRLEVGVLYNDGPFTVKNGWVMAWIHGSRTDSEHFMWLTAAEGARHKGVAGTGVVLDGRDRTRTGIIVEDDYTRIDGIELKRFGHWLVPAAVTVRGAMGVVLDGLIIHDFDTDRRRHETYGIKGGVYSSFTVRNCIIYGGGTAGIVARRRTADVEVENCTIYGMRGRGVEESLGHVSAINTLSMGNAGGDFAIRRGSQSFNMSSDGTAAGERSKAFRLPAGQFVSVQKGLEDFHLLETADAIDAGKNLAPLPAVARAGIAPDDDPVEGPAALDIDGTDRSQETDWDIGADEVESAPANVLYVDAAGSGDGRSWKSAFATIQQAVAAAAAGQEIWVRSGTYRLTETILIDKSVALYGGFSGNERNKERRDSTLQTVLDASLLRSAAGSVPSATTITGTAVVLNRFAFVSGGSSTTTVGGAVHALPGSSYRLEHCRFERNEGNNGGGLYSDMAAGVVVNCVFKENFARLSGGAIYSASSPSLLVVNCLFVDNSAGQTNLSIVGGGAVYVVGNGTGIYNCTFSGNTTVSSRSNAGGIYNAFANTVIQNCVIFGSTTYNRPQIFSMGPPPAVMQCNIDQPSFVDPYQSSNISRPPLWVSPETGDFRLQPGSPCIDAGSGNVPGLPATDFDGNPRVVGTAVDMGAFEFGN